MRYTLLFFMLAANLSAQEPWITGILPPCPESPNCVSSQGADDSHFVLPLALGNLSGEEAMAAHEEIILSYPRTKIIQREPGYIPGIS
ncbi:MAG: DUF1499 domain-containing protein [Spirochaetaceae bacterium]|jgi:uncharacterized protein (DUF1499 family)|nr:DUF1499 domain-containing protein [Spirochaetaceae bacterium]